MQYRFPRPQIGSTHFASGKVFYSAPGQTAFPVHLANELFLRALEYRRTFGSVGRQALFDPCCGGGALLVVVCALHAQHLSRVVAADVDAGALQLARRNLQLRTRDGLQRRIEELSELAVRFGKESHIDALRSARLLWDAAGTSPNIDVEIFSADVLTGRGIPRAGTVDMVLTDVPYGKEAHWKSAPSDCKPPIELMAANLLPVLSPAAVVTLVSDKAQKGAFPGYERLEKISIGRRRAIILRARE